MDSVVHQHLLDAGFGQHRSAPGRLDPSTNHAVEVEVDSLLGRCGLAGAQEVSSTKAPRRSGTAGG